MIFRLSQKLATKIEVAADESRLGPQICAVRDPPCGCRRPRCPPRGDDFVQEVAREARKAGLILRKRVCGQIMPRPSPQQRHYAALRRAARPERPIAPSVPGPESNDLQQSPEKLGARPRNSSAPMLRCRLVNPSGYRHAMGSAIGVHKSFSISSLRCICAACSGFSLDARRVCLYFCYMEG